MKTCDQCGNPVSAELYICPYCGGQELDVPSGQLVERTLDLGHAGLTTQEARHRLSDAINMAAYKGEDVLCVIHGYGSTGEGGRIASMVRTEATRAHAAGQLMGWVPGEELGTRSQRVRELERRLPALANLERWRRSNPGVTLLIIR